MKYHKFTLLTANPPQKYRFVKRGEVFLKTDKWWVSKWGNVEDYMKSIEVSRINIICNTDFPQVYPMMMKGLFGGFIRKID